MLVPHTNSILIFLKATVLVTFAFKSFRDLFHVLLKSFSESLISVPTHSGYTQLPTGFVPCHLPLSFPAHVLYITDV